MSEQLSFASLDYAADGAKDEVARIVADIREVWPRTTITIRADNGFCKAEWTNGAANSR